MPATPATEDRALDAVPVRLVVALPSEGAPLVARFGPREGWRAVPGPFLVHRGLRSALVVSGVGKAAAAAATAYLHATTGAERDAVWLNVGIAGARDLALGTGRLAYRIVDAASGRRWYPPPVLGRLAPRAEIVTVDRVETSPSTDALYEMEAAGFYPTATRFAKAECVHCYKIVSDNRLRGPEGIRPRLVADLVEAHLDAIEEILAGAAPFAAALRRLAAEPPFYRELTDRCAFTTSERRRLRRLLERWHALRPELPPPVPARAATAETVLRGIEEGLAALPVSLPGGRRR